MLNKLLVVVSTTEEKLHNIEEKREDLMTFEEIITKKLTNLYHLRNKFLRK